MNFHYLNFSSPSQSLTTSRRGQFRLAVSKKQAAARAKSHRNLDAPGRRPERSHDVPPRWASVRSKAALLCDLARRRPEPQLRAHCPQHLRADSRGVSGSASQNGPPVSIWLAVEGRGTLRPRAHAAKERPVVGCGERLPQSFSFLCEDVLTLNPFPPSYPLSPLLVLKCVGRFRVAMTLFVLSFLDCRGFDELFGWRDHKVRGSRGAKGEEFPDEKLRCSGEDGCRICRFNAARVFGMNERNLQATAGAFLSGSWAASLIWLFALLFVCRQFDCNVEEGCVNFPSM